MFDDFKNKQKNAYNILTNSLNQDKISHAYLIETQENEYGLDFALSYAKALLCPNKFTNNNNCGNCSQCLAIDNNNFIELEIIDTDDLWIKKESIINLQNDFNFKPIIGKNKVYIINHADKIRESIANTLLKFIEEPEPGIIAILIADNKNKILNTILSRCQIISLKNDILGKKDNANKFDRDLVDLTIKFMNCYENNKEETLLYTTQLVHDHLVDRSMYINFFEILVLFYKDILNYKLNNHICYFFDYENDIKSCSLKIENILLKVELILKLKKTIRNNVNLNLIIDKLIVELVRIDKNECL